MNIKFLCSQRAIKVLATGVAVFSLAACQNMPFQEKPKSESPAMDELVATLSESAKKVTAARLELVNMKPASTVTDSPAAAQPVAPTAMLDIDFVGPIERATQIVANSLGWQYSVQGKKRVERIVNLRHKKVDAVTVLRDIGSQCNNICDLQVHVVEGGQSSITLSFRD